MEKIKLTMDGRVYEVDKFSAITEFVHAHMQENKQKYVLAFCNRKLCNHGLCLCELVFSTEWHVNAVHTDGTVEHLHKTFLGADI